MFFLSHSVPAVDPSPLAPIFLAKDRLAEIGKLMKPQKFDAKSADLIGVLRATQLDLSKYIPELTAVDLAQSDKLRQNAATIKTLLRGYIRKNSKVPQKKYKQLSKRGRFTMALGTCLIIVGGIFLAVVILSCIPQTSDFVLPIFAWASKSSVIKGTKPVELLGVLTALGIAAISGGAALRHRAKRLK